MRKESLNPPRGTKDWIGKEALKRERIIEVVQEKCKLYGYSPISTPSLENIENLEAGYRGDKEPSLFRVMSRGQRLQRRYSRLLEDEQSENDIALKELTDLGLRYDITIPTSRILERYNLERYLPIKRYQIGQIWRTDKPSFGRLREFTVCDIDAFGSTNLVDDAESILLINDIFDSLSIPVEILVNNRKIISVAESFQLSEGLAEVDNNTLEHIEEQHKDNKIVLEGISELRKVLSILDHSHIPPGIVRFTPNLKRSLEYYEGTIIEVRVKSDRKLKSPVNGGRYSKASATFQDGQIHAVGSSMSLERMQRAMGEQEKEIVPNEVPDILITVSNSSLLTKAFDAAAAFRQNGINTMLYSNIEEELSDQLSYADKNNIRLVAMVMEDEIIVRDFLTGNQKNIDIENSESLNKEELLQQ